MFLNCSYCCRCFRRASRAPRNISVCRRESSLPYFSDSSKSYYFAGNNLWLQLSNNQSPRLSDKSRSPLSSAPLSFPYFLLVVADSVSNLAIAVAAAFCRSLIAPTFSVTTREIYDKRQTEQPLGSPPLWKQLPVEYR